jgi:hypothetical protein
MNKVNGKRGCDNNMQESIWPQETQSQRMDNTRDTLETVADRKQRKAEVNISRTRAERACA